ncbi:MAG TPA: hypothetical protein VGJ30_12360 [Candidatus Angelobacter sp.]|jgi:hypothetical protein
MNNFQQGADMPVPKNVQLTKPWQELPADQVSVLAAQLHRELSPRHVLYGAEARAVVARVDRDDVLFELIWHAKQLAQVHLTWSQRPPDDPKWPAVQFFATWDDWVQEKLLRDHEDYGE